MVVAGDKDRGREREREKGEKGQSGERGGAEVGGKLNLAQDVTAPGNTGASVQ